MLSVKKFKCERNGKSYGYFMDTDMENIKSLTEKAAHKAFTIICKKEDIKEGNEIEFKKIHEYVCTRYKENSII